MMAIALYTEERKTLKNLLQKIYGHNHSQKYPDITTHNILFLLFNSTIFILFLVK